MCLHRDKQMAQKQTRCKQESQECMEKFAKEEQECLEEENAHIAKKLGAQAIENAKEDFNHGYNTKDYVGVKEILPAPLNIIDSTNKDTIPNNDSNQSRNKRTEYVNMICFVIKDIKIVTKI